MTEPLSDEEIAAMKETLPDGAPWHAHCSERELRLLATIAARDEEIETRRLVAQANKGTAERLRVRVVQLEDALAQAILELPGAKRRAKYAALLSGSPPTSKGHQK